MAQDRSGSPLGSDDDVPVGTALARLRRHANITGTELGRRVGMSQPKISKIETGAAQPSVEDVERIALALGASEDEVDRLTELAQVYRDHMMDVRYGRNEAALWQREIAQHEADARELRIFQPAVISGLLQTSEYARAVLGTYQEAVTDAAGLPVTGVSEAVSARVQRQEILDDPAKQFHFVVPETLLRNLLSRAEDMPAQLSRIREVARQDNVTLRMIAEDAQWPYPPYHGFSLLDDRIVIIDLYNTILVTRGQSDIRLYRHVFDALESRATGDIEPILGKYRQLYLRRAQEA